MNSKILYAISDVILIVDQKGIIVDTNDSIADVFLWERKEVLNKPLSMLLPERFHEGHKHLFTGYTEKPASRRMGKGNRSKFKGIDRQGNEFFIDIALSSYQDEAGENFYTAVVRDISDIVNLSNDLEKSIGKLLDTNKKLDHFAHILSHDLKAPARNIKSLVQILHDNLSQHFSEDDTQLMEMVVSQSNKMSDLIDGVLEYTRASHSGGEKESISISELIAAVIEDLAIPKTFTIETDVVDDLFVVQKTQFSQALANLIGNAVKYHDRKDGHIAIKCYATIDEIVCSVKDDGPGIPAKLHDHIFQMFGTAHGETRSDSTGIGLAIVKKIVEDNEGTIQLDSAPGEGSTFTFTWRF